jgi:hypothetical protein
VVSCVTHDTKLSQVHPHNLVSLATVRNKKKHLVSTVGYIVVVVICVTHDFNPPEALPHNLVSPATVREHQLISYRTRTGTGKFHGELCDP